MAYSYVRYTGNGATTNYTISFPYISADHIKVRVDGVLTTLFSFLSASTIQMTVAPAIGAILEIRRETPKETTIVNFTDGSVLLERDLDLLATYDLYLAQETKDGLDSSITQDSLGVWQGQSKRLANLADPVAPQDAVTKAYTDVVLLAAATSASEALASANAAAASYDSFDDRYLGAKAVAPSLDNDGNALLTGTTFWDTVSGQMFVWSGTEWKPTFVTGNAVRLVTVATAAQTVVPTPTYVVGVNTLNVFLNGAKVLLSSDYTETSQSSITFVSPLTAGDEVEAIALQPYAIGTTGAESVLFTPAGTGAVATTVQSKLRESVSVLDFYANGVSGAPVDPTGAIDSTLGIQAAINYASTNHIGRIYAPSGKYKCGSLYLTYDAALNPGFNSAYSGRIELVGDGYLPEVDAIGYASLTNFSGTIFESTATTTSAIVIATAAQGTFVSTYPVRGSRISNCTVVANTTAYVIENNGAPEMSTMQDVTAVQRNAAGHGIMWASSWYSAMTNVLVTTTTGVVSTGSGLTFASTAFAGLFTFEKCYFKRFLNNVNLTTPLNSVEISFTNCSFEGAKANGVLVQNSCKTLRMIGCYWEGNATRNVSVELPATNYIEDLEITGFMYGGLTAGAAPSSQNIYISSAKAARVRVHFFRPWTTLVYNYYDSGSITGRATTLESCTVDFSGVTYGATTINCVDSNSQLGIPLLLNCELPSNAVFTPINATYYKPNEISGRENALFNPRFSQIYTYSTTGVNQTDTISLTQPTYRLYTVTNTGFGVEPPASANGRIYFIGNSSTSTQNLILFKVGASALATLLPGEGAIWVSNPLTNEFVAWKTTFIS